MSLVLNNTQIAVSPARLDYNKIRMKFLSLAQVASKEFSANYETRFKNLDDVHNHGNEAAYSHIRSAVEVALQHLVKRGIYDIDSDALFDFLDPYFTWPEDFADIEDAYTEIVSNAEALDEHRVNRRESRGRFVGVGFGAAGVAKGVVMAGAANVASSLAHRAVNGVGKIVSTAVDMTKKTAIFTAPATKQRLIAGIHRAVFNVHFALVDAANDKQPGSFTDLVTDEAHSKASRLLENVASGRLPEDIVPTVLIEALHLDPYNEKLYSLWFDQLGDQNGELEITENFFGVDVVGAAKRDLIAARRSTLDFTTPEACKGSLITLSRYAETIGYRHFVAEQTDILALADRLDCERRTVEGKEYTTLAHADAAREALRLEIIKRDNTVTSSGKDILKFILGGLFLMVTIGAMMGKASFLWIAIPAAIAIASFQGIRSIRVMKLANGIGCAIAALGALAFVSEIAADLMAKKPLSLSAFSGSALCIGIGWGIGKLMRVRYQEAGHGDFKQYFIQSVAGGAIIGALLGIVVTVFVPDPKPKATSTPQISVTPKPAATVVTPSPASPAVADGSATNALPFIGHRTFNFDGGNGTEQSITIAADGHTRVEYLGTSQTSVEFDGKFTNPLPLNGGRALLFKGHAVYATRSGKIEQGCRNERLDCADTLRDSIPAQAQPEGSLSLKTVLADGKSIVCRLNDVEQTCTDPEGQDGKAYLPDNYVISKGYTAILDKERFTEPGTTDTYIKFTVKP